MIAHARVFTTGKVSKKLGLGAAAAVIEGVEACSCQGYDVPPAHGCMACEGTLVMPGTATFTLTGDYPTPNSAAMHALALGVVMALRMGATHIEVISSSKNAIRAVNGEGGAKYETAADAHAAAWVIYWRETRARLTFTYRPAAEMPEAVEAAAGALKRANEPAENDEPVTLTLPV